MLVNRIKQFMLLFLKIPVWPISVHELLFKYYFIMHYLSSQIHWLDKFLLYLVADLNIVFLVPDSCWATERNGNIIFISADVTDDAFETV